MIELKPTRKFTHGGETFRPGDVLKVRDQRHADALKAKGLVSADGDDAKKADKAPAKKEASKPAKKADKAD